MVFIKDEYLNLEPAQFFSTDPLQDIFMNNDFVQFDDIYGSEDDVVCLVIMHVV